MLASLCRNHFVVIGVGKVGYQVIKGLLEMRETRRGDRDGQRRAAPGRAVRQGRAGDPGERPDGLGPGAGRRPQGQGRDRHDQRRPDEPRRRHHGARAEPRRQDRDSPVRRDPGHEGRRRLRHADDLDVAGGCARVHRRGDGPQDLPGRSSSPASTCTSPTSRSARPAASSVGPWARSSRTRRSTSSCTRAERASTSTPDQEIVLEPGDTILVIAPMEALLTLEMMNQAKECPDPSQVKVTLPANPRPVGGTPANVRPLS